jgi:hypothetical protein
MAAESKLMQKTKLISQYPEPPQQLFYNQLSYSQNCVAFIAKRAKLYEHYRRTGLGADEIAKICDDPIDAPLAYIAIVGPALTAMLPVDLSNNDVVIESQFAEDAIWAAFVAEVVGDGLLA